jgi:hypothetical protein
MTQILSNVFKIWNLASLVHLGNLGLDVVVLQNVVLLVFSALQDSAMLVLQATSV